jgi:hypothetical protein
MTSGRFITQLIPSTEHLSRYMGTPSRVLAPGAFAIGVTMMAKTSPPRAFQQLPDIKQMTIDDVVIRRRFATNGIAEKRGRKKNETADVPNHDGGALHLCFSFVRRVTGPDTRGETPGTLSSAASQSRTEIAAIANS